VRGWPAFAEHDELQRKIHLPTGRLRIARLAELERNDPKIANGVFDPSCFKRDGGLT
jgi:hypothetical protein